MNASTPLTARLLGMIALFEGSAGGKINTWDEQFLSLGTLHYAVGQGSGARFLMRVRELDPAGTLACLGREFHAAIGGGAASIVLFCRHNVWNTGQKWAGAFVALSKLEAFAQADLELAGPYLDGAKALALRYGLHSERGLAWCFDRSVQQGPSPRPYVDRVFRALPKGLPEEEILVDLASAYAQTSQSYSGVVLARSLTVARGGTPYQLHGRLRNTGYPGRVNLEADYGLSLTRLWNAPAVPRVFLKQPGGSTILWDGDESDVYGGQQLTRAWIEQMRLVYPAGTTAQLGGLTLTVHNDGAISLVKAGA